MRISHTLLAALVALTGCGTTNKASKVDNPVMGDPPPRKVAKTQETPDRGKANASPTAQRGDPSTRQKINLIGSDNVPVERRSAGINDLADYQVVAKVNGAPIFAYEVLEPYAKFLSERKQAGSTAEYRGLRNALIKQHLRPHIERKLVIESLNATLKPAQVKQLEQHVEGKFEQELGRLKKELKVKANLELDRELQNQGMSLAGYRNRFINQQMAREYVAAKSQPSQSISRKDLIEYYQAHLDEYALSSQVKWSQIVISHSKRGGKPEALKVFEKVVAELKRGTAFSEVASLYSDGPTARDGGRWDWTRGGSLADKEIEKALFELPVGVISQPFDKSDAFQLVQVTERQDAGRIPFEDVQDQIMRKLQQQTRQGSVQDFLDELLETADIWTIFDDE